MTRNADPPGGLAGSAPRGSGAPASSDANDRGASSGGDPDWSDWLDGRPRRLKRGRDYAGDPRPLVKRARETAERMGKLAVSSRDSQGKYEYIWIQFVDGEVLPGEPCVLCGATTLAKAQKHFLRCTRCAATLKATGDWTVEAGEYGAAPCSSTGLATVGDAGHAPRAEDFAEVLRAKLLTADSRPLREPLVTQSFLLHFEIRFLRPVAVALPRLRLSVADAGPLLRVQPPRPIEDAGVETVDVCVEVPGNLLMPRVYSVEIALLLCIDRASPADYIRLTAADVLSFRVRKVGGRSVLDAAKGPSAFAWFVGVRGDATS